MRRFYAVRIGAESARLHRLKPFILLLCVGAFAQVRPFVEYSKPVHLSGWTAKRVVVDATGNTVLALAGPAFVLTPGESLIQVLDSTGAVRCTHDFNGSVDSQIEALYADSNGFVYAGGRTRSRDFPVVNAIQPQPPEIPGMTGFWAGFLVKFRPCGAVQFGTYMGEAATVSAIATGPGGDIYFAGYTSSGRFPTTPGAFQTSIGQPHSVAAITQYGFIARLSADGRRFAYSTYMSGTKPNCFGGGACVSVGPNSSPRAITIAPNGDAVVAGETNTNDFPVTSNNLQNAGPAFVSRIDARGERLVYSTYLGRRAVSPTGLVYGTSTPAAVWLTSSGSTWVAGVTDATDFPVTADAVQPEYRGCRWPACPLSEPEGFISQISVDGRLAYSSYFGGQRAQITATSIRPNGEIWLAGGPVGADFPVTPSAMTRGGDFLTRLAPDGRTVLFSTQLPSGLARSGALAVVGDDPVLVSGDSGQITRLRLRNSTEPAMLGVANAAAGPVRPCVSPGEIVSVYGIDIGTARPTGYRLDGFGRVASDLDGLRLHFNGMPAPLLYAQSDQINAVTPFGLPETGTVNLTLIKNGVEIRDVLSLCAEASGLQGFQRIEQGAQPGVSRSILSAINQDGTLNSQTNPAARGSIVAFFLSGAGAWKTNPVDGEISPLVAQHGLLKYALSADPLEVTFAGPAPGQIAGLVQVNVRMPPQSSGPPTGSILTTIRIFNGSSETFGNIWVR